MAQRIDPTDRDSLNARALAGELQRYLPDAEQRGPAVLVAGWRLRYAPLAIRRPLDEAWQRTVDEAEADGLKPALAHRVGTGPWTVRAWASSLDPTAAASKTTDVSLRAFAGHVALLGR